MKLYTRDSRALMNRLGSLIKRWIHRSFSLRSSEFGCSGGRTQKYAFLTSLHQVFGVEVVPGSDFEAHRWNDVSEFGAGAGSRAIYNLWEINWRHFTAYVDLKLIWKEKVSRFNVNQAQCEMLCIH